MSNSTETGEVYENGQQREDDALAVITEFSEPSAQNATDPPVDAAAAATENQAKENEHHDDQQQQAPQPQYSESGASAEAEDKPKEAGMELEEDGDKSKLAEDKKESDTATDKVTSVGTILVENQEVVTSSTGQQRQQRKNSTGRARSTARRASYQTSRSYAGGSFQNYGLTYLPYKSNFEPSEDARRKADEFFKTLKL